MRPMIDPNNAAQPFIPVPVTAAYAGGEEHCSAVPASGPIQTIYRVDPVLNEAGEVSSWVCERYSRTLAGVLVKVTMHKTNRGAKQAGTHWMRRGWWTS